MFAGGPEVTEKPVEKIDTIQKSMILWNVRKDFFPRRFTVMERIQTLETRDLCESAKNGGCGECQTSCQSACKTSCGVANQKCENTEE